MTLTLSLTLFAPAWTFACVPGLSLFVFPSGFCSDWFWLMTHACPRNTLSYLECSCLPLFDLYLLLPRFVIKHCRWIRTLFTVLTRTGSLMGCDPKVENSKKNKKMKFSTMIPIVPTSEIRGDLFELYCLISDSHISNTVKPMLSK